MTNPPYTLSAQQAAQDLTGLSPQPPGTYTPLTVQTINSPSQVAGESRIKGRHAGEIDSTASDQENFQLFQLVAIFYSEADQTGISKVTLKDLLRWLKAYAPDRYKDQLLNSVFMMNGEYALPEKPGDLYPVVNKQGDIEALYCVMSRIKGSNVYDSRIFSTFPERDSQPGLSEFSDRHIYGLYNKPGKSPSTDGTSPVIHLHATPELAKLADIYSSSADRHIATCDIKWTQEDVLKILSSVNSDHTIEVHLTGKADVDEQLKETVNQAAKKIDFNVKSIKFVDTRDTTFSGPIRPATRVAQRAKRARR